MANRLGHSWCIPQRLPVLMWAQGMQGVLLCLSEEVHAAAAAAVGGVRVVVCCCVSSEQVMESLERFVMLATSNDITRAAVDHGHVRAAHSGVVVQGFG